MAISESCKQKMASIGDDAERYAAYIIVRELLLSKGQDVSSLPNTNAELEVWLKAHPETLAWLESQTQLEFAATADSNCRIEWDKYACTVFMVINGTNTCPIVRLKTDYSDGPQITEGVSRTSSVLWVVGILGVVGLIMWGTIGGGSPKKEQ